MATLTTSELHPVMCQNKGKTGIKVRPFWRC